MIHLHLKCRGGAAAEEELRASLMAPAENVQQYLYVSEDLPTT